MQERPHIAVGVDQMGFFWQGHFGMSPSYRIYDCTGTLITTRPNPYGTGQRHAKHHDNPHLIVDLLPECGVFLSCCMGERSKARLESELGIEAVLTEATDPETAIRDYLATANRKEQPC